MPTTAAIPGLGAVKDPAVRRVLQAVVEQIEVREGRRVNQDPLERFVTLRELGSGTGGVGEGGGGSGGGAGTGTQPPAGESGRVEPPTRPRGVLASGGFGNVVLSWRLPTYAGHAYTEVVRSTSTVLGEAVRQATPIGPPFADLSVAGDTTYHYWLRHVNRNDVAGPWSPRITASTAPNTDFILGEISGEIARSDLAQALRETVDLIDTPDTGLLDRLSTAEADIVANQQALNELAVTTGQGMFDPAPGSIWQFEGSTDGWSATNASLATHSFYVRLSGAAAVPQFDSPPGLGVDGGLYTTVIARLRRVSGTGWTGRVYYDNGTHGFSGSFYEELPKPADLDTGDWVIVAWDMETLTAGGTDWLDSTVEQLRLELGADGTDVIDIDWVGIARYSPPASARALQALDVRVTGTEDTLTAQATQIDQLQADLGSVEEDVGANATVLSQLDTRVTQTEDDVSAQADALTQIATTVDGNTAAVQQHAQSLDGLEAQFTVKLDVNGAVAGFGLATTPSDDTGDGQFSEFYVNADRFAVLPQGSNPGSAAVAPFVVQDNQVLLNELIANRITVTDAMIEELNAAKLFAAEGTLAEALIGQAEITSAMIGQAVINESHLGQAIINAAHIGQAEVDTLHLRGEAVTVSTHFVSTGTVDLSTSPDYSGWTGWTNLAAISIDSEGNPVGVWFSAKLMFAALVTNLNVNSGRARLEFRLRRGGTELQRFRWYDWVTDSRTNRETVMFSYRDAAPPSGTNTYRVQARVYDSRTFFRVDCELSHRTLFNLGTKR